MSEGRSTTNASSTGQTRTEGGFLDAHFEACRPEYEAMLRSVGLEPGWRVLDAACGSGGFLPLIAEQGGVPDGDRELWRRQQDPDSPDSLAHHPELYWCEGSFVAVGRVPASKHHPS